MKKRDIKGRRDGYYPVRSAVNVRANIIGGGKVGFFSLVL